MGVKLLIITNDVVTTEDAKHVQRTLKGILIEERIPGETGACPHTAVREDPSMNLAAVEDMEAKFPDGDLVLIESGGDNLTLTSARRWSSFSSTSSTSRPATDSAQERSGHTRSDILVINKTDLAPHVGAGLEVMERLAPDARRQAVSFTNCRTGEGRRAGQPDPPRHPVRFEAQGRGECAGPTLVADTRRPRGVFGAHAPELAYGRARRCPAAPSGRTAICTRVRTAEQAQYLARLDRRVPFLVQRALYWDEGMPQLPCVFIITTSGCVLQGDRLSLDVELAPGAQAHLTTQAATKIHSMDANYAAQVQTIRAGDESYLEFLPDTIIPHRHSRFHSETRISVAPSATVIYSEILLSGRKHHQSTSASATTFIRRGSPPSVLMARRCSPKSC
jgi:urease accessory protein UreG